MTQVVLTAASGDWLCPDGVTSVTVQAQGEGGNGAEGISGSHSGGAGGGGGYVTSAVGVTGGTSYAYTIGQGGSATDTVFTGDTESVTADYGGSASGTAGGTAGSGSATGTGTVIYAGGTGGSGLAGASRGGGGGGGGGGSGGAGTAGGEGGASGASGAAGAGGSGTVPGGSGGAGGNGSDHPAAGTAPGGGGGGGCTNTSQQGAAAAAGQIVLTYTQDTEGGAGLSGTGTMGAAAAVSGTISGEAGLSGTGTVSAGSALAGAGVVNQWAASYAQVTDLGEGCNPALMSCVVPLNPNSQVAPGTGYPSAGNWLFVICGWRQPYPSASPVTVGISDDIHSYWRPSSPSEASGIVRAVVWYTANLARQPGYVYAAPNGAMSALAVLVIEVESLGPWDSVTGASTAYDPDTGSLTLTLPAPR